MFDANGDSGTGVSALQREVKSSDSPSVAATSSTSVLMKSEPMVLSFWFDAFS
jgi:hypothetical protein